MGDGLDGTAAFERIPFDQPIPRLARNLFADAKAGLDFVAHNLPAAHRLLVRLNPYPHPWQAASVPGHDGAMLAGWYTRGAPGGPTVLFAPGTFQTKDDTPRKRRAIDLWRRLGASVLILDLRGFGGSHEHPGVGGYLEARDLHTAADWLRTHAGTDRVTLWGESLGGAAALLAGALPGAHQRFDQVVAWSPYADLEDASRAASPDDARGRTLVGRAYRMMLRARLGAAYPNFHHYLAERAEELGFTTAEFWREGSPLTHVARLEVPSIVFHAQDDTVVPVEHARLLAEAASRDARLLKVHVVPRGGHLLFDRHAPSWYEATTRALLLGQGRAGAS